MRVLVVGDQHFRYELPYASLFKDGRKSEWEGVKKTIHDTAKNCDAIVLIGDNFNARHNHSSVIREFVDFLNGFGDKEVHILVGNHERYGVSTALDFLQKLNHPNWFVYSEPKLATVAGAKAMMIPYMTPALLGVETKEEALEVLMAKMPSEKIPLAFAHHGFAGGKIRGFPIEMLNEIVLPEKAMSQHFGHIFAGHIHEKQVIYPNIYMTGNIFTNEVGEHDKSVWVYGDDGTTKRIDQIELPVRGIYKIVWEENGQGDIPKESIVKCYVTSRVTSLDAVRVFLEGGFDASIIIEQYPNERAKVHFEEGGLDLSVESMLQRYSEAKGLLYTDLQEGFDLIK